VVFGHNAALACHMSNESYFPEEHGDVGRRFQPNQEFDPRGNLRLGFLEKRAENSARHFEGNFR